MGRSDIFMNLLDGWLWLLYIAPVETKKTFLQYDVSGMTNYVQITDSHTGFLGLLFICYEHTYWPIDTNIVWTTFL